MTAPTDPVAAYERENREGRARRDAELFLRHKQMTEERDALAAEVVKLREQNERLRAICDGLTR